jgi:5-carboxymethyl-2-hydroxymuconic-semialdehyde dehydrogenase
LVERTVYDSFLARLSARAARVRVGDPADPATEIGALVHPEHYDRVMSYVRLGAREGARLVAGGSRPAGLGTGNYLAATVFADVQPSMRIFTEEIFGPVVCVTPFDSEQEAVTLANATRYGLAAYLWTSDLARAHRVAGLVESGMTWINSHNVRDLRTPFGGVKASGLGREGGQHSIDFYTESRSCTWHWARRTCRGLEPEPSWILLLPRLSATPPFPTSCGRPTQPWLSPTWPRRGASGSICSASS